MRTALNIEDLLNDAKGKSAIEQNLAKIEDTFAGQGSWVSSGSS